MVFAGEAAAKRGYLANYKKGWKGLGAITPMPMDQFKEWVKTDAAKKPLGLKETESKPVDDQKDVNSQPKTDADPSKNPTASKKKPNEKSGEKIEDFGQKIGGARKDLAGEYAAMLDIDVDLATTTMAKAFPAPNYKKLEADGTPKRSLAAVALLRAAVGTKPKRGSRLRRWINDVGVHKEAALQIMNGAQDPDTFMLDKHVLDVMEALSVDKYPTVAKANLRLANGRIRVGDGELEQKTWMTGRIGSARGYRYEIETVTASDTEQEVVDKAIAYIQKVLEQLPKANSPSRAKKRLDIAVYRNVPKKEFYIAFKSPGGMLRLRDGIADKREAFKIISEQRNQLEAEVEEKRKNPPILRRDENEDRKGITKLDGDVTPEQFSDTFGFYGVEFGNYVEGPRRQQDLNQAYEALMDLASAIDLPPKALSLNGTLGLAFGARGRGGKNPAAAHYEPGKIAINLTKSSGPGSLAHEWLHGMDNYFARQAAELEGRKPSQNFITQAKGQKPEGIRPEVYDAVKALSKSIRDSEFRKRSAEIDAGRSKPYYGTIIEMAARAFEKYIVMGLIDVKIRNDYLANIDEKGGAYPTDEEMAGGIREAYDKLFDIIETRETDDSVEMFKKSVAPEPGKPGLSVSEVTAVVKRVQRRWKNSPAIKIVQNGADIPGIDPIAAKNPNFRGLYRDKEKTIYIVASNNKTARHVEEVLLHERQHSKTRDKYGKETTVRLSRLAKLIEEQGTIRDFIQKRGYEYDYDGYESQFAAQGIPTSVRKAKHIDELLAMMAEDKASTVGRIRRAAQSVLTAIRTWLRENGFKLLASLPNDELVSTLRETDRLDNDPGEKTREISLEISQVATDADMFLFRQAIDRSKPGMQKFGKWIKRNFHTGGLLNDAIHRRKLDADAMKNVGESEVAALVHDLESIMTEVYGAGRYMKVPLSAREAANRYLGGDNSVELDKRVTDVLDTMRGHLDGLSGEMIQAISDMVEIDVAKLTPKQYENLQLFMATNGEEGNIPRRLQKNLNTWMTIRSNIGEYLNRSYRAFDDPDWMEKANRDAGLIGKAEAFIAKQNPGLTADEITGAVQAILQDAKESGNFAGFIAKGGKYGSKDSSFLKKRKNVPPVIRELLGEYTDVRMNYVRSASKMKWYVANHHFLMGVRNAGLGDFLHEKPTGKEWVSELAGDESETMNPLNGLYTSEDIKIGLEDALNKSDSSAFMRRVISINSLVKYGKTILAPTTQARNFISASMFTVMNGHFDWSAIAGSFKATKADLFTKDAAWRTYLDHLIGLGVLHDNPYAGELRDAIQDFTDADKYDQGAKAFVKSKADFLQRVYQAGDDFWKIIGFEAELKKQLNRGLSQADAEREAANRIRNGYPTYSMVPRSMQFIRRAPLVGTFVSFPWEIMRTTKNQFGFIKDDWQAGHKKDAGQRIAGVMLIAGVSAGASKLSMMAMGMSDDDDEAVRNLLPPWNRNSQLLYLGYDESGMPSFLDLSYFDPYTYLKKPVSALINGNNQSLTTKLHDSLTEMADPFVGVDIAAGTVMDVLYNKKRDGYGTVYNEADTVWRKGATILGYLRKNLQPGVVSNIERTAMALQGDVSYSGREYTLKDEAMALVGFRTSTLNIPQSLIYKSYEFNDTIRSATTIVSRIANSPQRKTDREVKAAVEAMNRARSKAFTEMHRLVNGAESLGVGLDKADALMKVARISKANRKAILAGETPPWSMSKRFGKSAQERAAISQLDPDNRRNVLERLESRRELVRELSGQ